MNGVSKRRVPNNLKNVGALRQILWAKSKKRMQRAIKSGFWLEAIAIQESMIADRLESAIQIKDSEVAVNNLNQALKRLKEEFPGVLEPDLEEQVRDWWSGRNSALHGLVKLSEESLNDSWSMRLANARNYAKSGVEIVNEIDKLTKRVKRKVFADNC